MMDAVSLPPPSSRASLSTHETTRERIQTEAARLFVASGYHGVSMREVAEAVGVTKTALYHHYADKEALFLAMLDGALATLARLVEHAGRQPGIRQQLDTLIRDLLDTAPEQRVGLQLASELRHVSPERRAAFENGKVDAWVIWEPFLSAAQRQLPTRTLEGSQGLASYQRYYLTSSRFAAAHPQVLQTVYHELAEAGDLRRFRHHRQFLKLERNGSGDGAVRPVPRQEQNLEVWQCPAAPHALAGWPDGRAQAGQQLPRQVRALHCAGPAQPGSAPQGLHRHRREDGPHYSRRDQILLTFSPLL